MSGVVGGLGDAEVDEHRAVVGDDDVARLEVAVHHAGVVHRGERVAQALGEVEQLLGVQRAALAHVLLEVVARDELGDEERLGRVGLGVEHAATPGCRSRCSACTSRRSRSRATASVPTCGCSSLSATASPPPSTAR